MKQGVVRQISGSFAEGQTSGILGRPDVALARIQHEQYTKALASLGIRVTVLPPLEAFPDSCFVEDATVMIHGKRVVTRPGHPSRSREAEILAEDMRKQAPEIGRINEPGTLDGGDVLVLGERMWIGITARTNEAGAEQLAVLAEQEGLAVRMVPVKHALHLKTLVGEAGENRVLISERLAEEPAFSDVEKIVIAVVDEYACNCRFVNEHLLMAAGFPTVARRVREAGIKMIPVALSEFQKMDGGVSCLSVLW